MIKSVKMYIEQFKIKTSETLIVFLTAICVFCFVIAKYHLRCWYDLKSKQKKLIQT